MAFQLKQLSGTSNYVILQQDAAAGFTLLVAEVVQLPDGYAIYRMDVTGVLATELDSPTDALSAFESWVVEHGVVPGAISI